MDYEQGRIIRYNVPKDLLDKRSEDFTHYDKLIAILGVKHDLSLCDYMVTDSPTFIEEDLLSESNV
jgi:hypothetical protein